METCILAEPGKFVRRTAEVPTPKENEVLIKPGAVGVCGTDYHAFDGCQNFFTYPRIIGHEIGATVVALGPGCASSGLSVGDKVAVVPYWECGKCIACRWGKPNCCVAISVAGVHGDGAMREYLCAPKTALVKSDKLSLEQLALVETLCIGAHAVFRGTPRDGEKALVIGAGPIGMGTAQFAKAAGCEVAVMDINQSRLNFVATSVGIAPSRLINTKPSDGTAVDAMALVVAACGGELPTLVFDATGNVKSMEGAFSYVAHGGKLVFVGHQKGPVSFENPLFHSREMTVLASRNALASDFERVIRLIEDGEVDVSPWITHRCPLKDFEAHFAKWKKPETGVIKAIVQVSQCEPCEDEE